MKSTNQVQCAHQQLCPPAQETDLAMVKVEAGASSRDTSQW